MKLYGDFLYKPALLVRPGFPVRVMSCERIYSEFGQDRRGISHFSKYTKKIKKGIKYDTKKYFYELR